MPRIKIELISIDPNSDQIFREYEMDSIQKCYAYMSNIKYSGTFIITVRDALTSIGIKSKFPECCYPHAAGIELWTELRKWAGIMQY